MTWVPQRRVRAPIERFWRFVEKTDSCWPWTGGRAGGPPTARYGSFIVRQMGELYAHRFAYRHFKGPIPAGMFVCHTCDNPICVNPDHLFLGTHTDNMRDASRKGRTARGERHGLRRHPEAVARGERGGTVRLTAAAVIDVRARYAAGGVTHQQLADEYGVKRETVSLILRGKNWRHLLPAHAIPKDRDRGLAALEALARGEA